MVVAAITYVAVVGVVVVLGFVSVGYNPLATKK